jgi:transcriptional regulator with XRE-family HTH domain
VARIQHPPMIRTQHTSTGRRTSMAIKPRKETDFAKRLRQLRDQRGLSQTELGQLVNIHYTHIGRYEAGRSIPTAETLKALANALGVTADYIMDGATTDMASARLTDRELIQRFQDVERLPEEDKAVVKKLLDAFLAMHQLKSYANRQAV